MRMQTLLAVALSGLALASCGGDEAEDPPTPEQVSERLQDDGYVVGEVITDGANIGVARGGRLDAEAYLGVDTDPEGERLYVGIYFFETAEDAAVLAADRDRNTDDDDFFSEQVGERVYEIAGADEDLTEVIASGEAE